MTKEEFEDYLVLQDKFMDKCNTIASIFAEVVKDFMYADNWFVKLPIYSCSGYREPGYVHCRGLVDRVLHIPFEYFSMTEDELRDVVKNTPEKIEDMVCIDEYWDKYDPDDLSDIEKELDDLDDSDMTTLSDFLGVNVNE